MKLAVVAKLLLVSIGMSIWAISLQAAEISDEVVDLSNTLVGNSGLNIDKSDVPVLAISPFVVEPSNPSYDNTTVTVGTRGNYYDGAIATGAPFGSTIDGVELYVRVSGIRSTDRPYLYIYFCRHNRTDCRQVTGEGTLVTDEWDGTRTWAGDTELSPGWEVVVGVAEYEGAPFPMKVFTVDASVTMGWEE